LLCLSNSLIAKTRGDNNRSHPQCTHGLDHHNLPVVAGDCLLALPITLRRSAAMHPSSTEVVGMMFSVIVKRDGFTKQILSQWTRRISFFDLIIAAVQPLAHQGTGWRKEAVIFKLFSKSSRGISVCARKAMIAATQQRRDAPPGV
jgi:hypothetical protein